MGGQQSMAGDVVSSEWLFHPPDVVLGKSVDRLHRLPQCAPGVGGIDREAASWIERAPCGCHSFEILTERKATELQLEVGEPEFAVSLDLGGEVVSRMPGVVTTATGIGGHGVLFSAE